MSVHYTVTRYSCTGYHFEQPQPSQPTNQPTNPEWAVDYSNKELSFPLKETTRDFKNAGLKKDWLTKRDEERRPRGKIDEAEKKERRGTKFNSELYAPT